MSVSFHKAPLAAAVLLSSATALTHAQQLEEVIVTAQKRLQSLQDVPISVSALQGDKLQSAGISNMQAMSDHVPNLYIAAGSINTNIYMRGVGSGANQGFEQSVGMYVDGVYMGRGRQYRASFLDLERVEVLRGPQGTLFGKNTVAGAINVITASPDPGGELQGEVALSAESHDGYIAEGFVQGSPSDNLGLRLGFKYRETDGYMDNDFLGSSEGQIEEAGLRFTAVWQATDQLNVNFKYSRMEHERVGSPSTTKLYLADPAQRDALFPNRSAFANIAYLLTDTFFPNFDEISRRKSSVYKDNGYGNSRGDGLGIGKNPDGADEEYDTLVLNLDYELSAGTLTSVTGWTSYEFTDGIDVDWLPIQLIHRDDFQEYEQFSQELRFASQEGEFFEYVVGGYFEKNDLEIDRRVTADLNADGLVPQLLGVNSLFTLLTGGAYSANQLARNHYHQQDSESWALFGQGTFNLRDDLRVSLGLRYTEDKKDVVSRQFVSDDLTGVGVPSDNYFAQMIEATSFNSYPFNFREKRKTDKWLPSINVQWDVTPDSLLYASFSQGFKSGGFTDADDQEPGQLSPGTFPCSPGQAIEACYDPTIPNEDFEFEDEEVDAFEIGGKHMLFDSRLMLNWAAFYTRYDNLQTSIFKGISFGVTNAAKSDIQGLELDLLWQASDRLRVGLNAAWLDASYDKFPDAPCTALQLDVDPACGTELGFSNNDLSGEPTAFAPKYTASLNFDYALALNNGLELFAAGETNYRDDFEPGGDNDPIDRIDGYSKTNLRLGLRAERWELMAFGRNIFDKEIFIQSFDTPILAGTHSQFVDEGRILGVRFKYSF
ncbi:TonB-dependent receptor [Parahaliea sp. F7430]|uniref:TonB-dependent receptor n=1 Tax=Sediminihaliea albiluteola TaxID=2758564 RepID=A0A7W2TYN8_9GAMM|nr:TonB-dependent receptor [Sediminihaliea albiluteola]MBA6414372.1 TonB-dependent receptor [Sediminihaliea albiluteola]